MQTEADRDRFLDVPARVYGDDPNWVPPLRSEIAAQIAPESPFWEYGSLQAFLALESDRRHAAPVGRIVAAVNRRLIEREGEAIGLFGFFECIESQDIAAALLSAAENWLREQGATKGRGPVDLSTHNRCLFLVEGFSAPMVMMPYNRPYYGRLVEQCGWQRAIDAYAYDLPLDRPLPPRFERAYRVALKSGIRFRSLRTRGDAFDTDAIALYQLFTRAFANNWSATPRSQAEFLEEAKSLQSLVDPDIFPIAEHNGEMVGFFMALPDYNIALKHVGGKLGFLGILKFLWFRRQINRARVVVLCALPQYRRQMVAPALIYLGHKGGTQASKRYRTAELGCVYETNAPSRHAIEAAGARIVKTYRAYEKTW